MKYKLRVFVSKYILLPIFGLKNSVKIFFYIKRRKKIDFESPKTFSEKIQIRKVNNKEIYSICADKVKVRDYIKEKIKDGDKYLIKQYFQKEKITIDDLEKLPNSFVLKTNNGCKTNIIVYDKSKEDLSKLVSIMNKYVTKKFGYNSFEMFYNDIKPLIIAEEFIGDKNIAPDDYKFHMFNQGNGKYIIKIQVDHDRFTEHSRVFYDELWNKEEYGFGIKNTNISIPKPSNLEEMIDFAKKIASDFDYVRVDLYSVKGKTYFGELTFTHGSGYEKFYPSIYDEKWGSFWLNK